MSEQDNPEDSRLFITSLARGLHLLAAFREDHSSMKLADLALAANMSKSAAQRFTHTLVTLGYLRKNDVSKEYSLAPRSLEVGLRYLQTSQLISNANPYLHSLNRACQETCSLAELDGLDMVYVSRFPAQKEMFVNMPIGMRLPVYCTASGRALLSRLEPERASEMLAACTRVAYTTETITDLAKLEALLAEARTNGFAWANGEYYNGDINVSAAILAPNGKPVGSVNVSAPSSRWTLAKVIDEIGPQVLETARAIGGSSTSRAR
ncbi:IclR family transcriptional regulator [Caballeronia sordidicola]|uniref:IclR family transcriptional regulator n=1 Tax=Caballeronia sordidicola TaxID=196367 RepID=A0A158ESH3_CABSO|nr:IclR family transcriptional regulator [Caballeronia sordidicola]SAL10497.1 IclR family transcriptional regulator [Caballeronia sordidicola]